MTATPKMSPQNTDAPAGELDETSLSAIRSILTAQEAPAPQAALGRIKPVRIAVEAEAPLPPRKSDGLPELAAPVQNADEKGFEEKKSKPKRKLGFSVLNKLHKPKSAKVKASKVAVPRVQMAGGGALLDRVKAYRPTKAHIGLGLLLLLIVMRPWLMLGLLFLSLIIMIGVFLMVGYDGFWQGVMKTSRWYATRRPSRAAAIHARLDRFAMRWDAILDRFPEGTVDSFYLPDFSELATADARHEAALERRLAGLSSKGA